MLIIVRKASVFYGKINLTDKNGNTVVLSDGDELIFSVKKSLATDSPVIIRKSVSDYDQINGAYLFTLSADETNIPHGTYFYDIALKLSNGEFYHVTPADQFIVKETVSRKE